jgi:hypothetical protein
MPDCHGLTTKEFDGHTITFHNDFDILPCMENFLKLIRFKPNWILQQLLKLLQRVTTTEYYYVIDADIVPLTKMSLFDEQGKPVLFSRTNPKDETAFVRFIAKATGGDLVSWTEDEYCQTNFIADMQLFKTAWVDEMIMRYFHSAEEFILFTCFNTYWSNTPDARRRSIFISEYIMYSLYVAKYHPGETSIVIAETKHINKLQHSQREQVFSDDEIKREIATAVAENHMFLRLQSNCAMSDIKYVRYNAQRNRPLKDYLKPYNINGISRIRIGRRGDGGYVVPKEILPRLSHCVTYGVANDVSFENDLMKNSSCDFILYDGTVNGLPSGSPRKYVFSKLNISSVNSGNTITPAKTIESVLTGDANANILLKCDIEGCEYGVLQTLSDDQLKHISVLVIEIHWIHSQTDKCRALLEFIDKQFILFHVHGNTCSGASPMPDEFGPGNAVPDVLELTYVNRAIAQNVKPYTGKLPDPSIDVSNNKSVPDYDLQFLVNS